MGYYIYGNSSGTLKRVPRKGCPIAQRCGFTKYSVKVHPKGQLANADLDTMPKGGTFHTTITRNPADTHGGEEIVPGAEMP